ncbi:acyl-CoA dehydrogenase family protein [Streptomyces deccanensis]|uniref:acyl-CoA dehydrogenase family protein n=1 Tax=Streptomyces deccanensis TaxID=424188 RepID=UPI001EFA849B|nr:acyl-CoA dehydrogenase family protein [Streptomyces deccanensis]ULR54159.1 acyl-CoA dehydrogenase family protein [Streptomyces deccanensis]
MEHVFTTQDHEDLRQRVREFAERVVRPLIPEMEASRTALVGLSRLIAQQGWIGATIDPAYGGMGAGHLAKTIIIEELSRVSGAMGAMVQASQLGVAKIIHFGDDSQKRYWLPRIAAGEVLPTIAVTEPGSGGHVAGMESSAVRDGDDYVLNGRKVFVGNSHVGDVHGVVVRTGPGSKGMTAFLVESDRPGFSLAPQVPSMGLHGFSFGELIFDNCRVPAANRLGEEGEGLAVAYSSSVLYGRLNLTAVSLGIHQAVFEETARYCGETERYGKPLGHLPNIKIELGRMLQRLTLARQSAYLAAHLLDNGRPCDVELMSAKLYNVEASIESAQESVKMHAACGLFTDRPVERYLRDAFHIYAPAGTSEIQGLRLGEFALGENKGEWSERLSELVRTPQVEQRQPEPEPVPVGELV